MLNLPIAIELPPQVDALLVLSCDDLSFSPEQKNNGRPARLIKFKNLRSLTFLATVLHHEAATLLEAELDSRPDVPPGTGLPDHAAIKRYRPRRLKPGTG